MTGISTRLGTQLSERLVSLGIIEAQLRGGGPFWRHRLGAADSALDIWTPFPIFILFFELWRKNHEAGNTLNAVEHEPT